MKNYTPALINNREKGKGFKFALMGQASKEAFYRGFHKSESRVLMWIEASKFGVMRTYPCVIEDNGDIFIYSKTSPYNGLLTDMWKEMVSVENVGIEYKVEELSKSTFNQIFGDYQRRYIRSRNSYDEEPEEQEAEEVRQITDEAVIKE